MLSDSDYQSTISELSQQFAALIEHGDLDAAVTSCPGWTFTELAQHMCGTQRWAIHALITGERGEHPNAPTERTALLDYFNEGSRQLVEASKATDPERPTWSFGPEPRIARFWSRRQAQEITVHLWDAYESQGQTYEVPSQIAVDGINEIAEVFFPMRLKRGDFAPLPQKIVLAPLEITTRIELAADLDGTGPTITLSGSASNLLLLLWGRQQLSAIDIQGDAALAEEFLAQGVSP